MPKSWNCVRIDIGMRPESEIQVNVVDMGEKQSAFGEVFCWFRPWIPGETTAKKLTEKHTSLDILHVTHPTRQETRLLSLWDSRCLGGPTFWPLGAYALLFLKPSGLETGNPGFHKLPPPLSESSSPSKPPPRPPKPPQTSPKALPPCTRMHSAAERAAGQVWGRDGRGGLGRGCLVAWFARIGNSSDSGESAWRAKNRSFNCEWFARTDSRESRCESPVPLRGGGVIHVKTPASKPAFSISEFEGSYGRCESMATPPCPKTIN